MSDDMNDDEPRTKTVTIRCRWESSHEIEVPEDFTVPSTLDGFPAEALEEMTAETAELVDWW